jgi:small subunit ribosomal protein S20
MPNNKQSEKRLRQDEKKRLTNKRAKSAMRTAIRKVTDAPDPEAATAAVPEAYKCIDKAAQKNVIHANAAARYKSSLHRTAAKK